MVDYSTNVYMDYQHGLPDDYPDDEKKNIDIQIKPKKLLNRYVRITRMRRTDRNG